MKVKASKEEAAETVTGSDKREVVVWRRVGEDGSDEPGKTVVVGVKMDPRSRELLTWALVKVAQPGDCVIALHVLPSSSFYERLDPEGSSSASALDLVKAFDSVLAVYDGFCNLKQIDLKLKICRGSSVCRVLVREANNIAASKLIVGIAKNNLSIRKSSTSTAKYCAKKLSCDCAVLAVNNGKVVFQREATEYGKENKFSCPISFAGKNNQNSGKNSETSHGNLPCSTGIKCQEGKNDESHMHSRCFDGNSKNRSDSDEKRDVNNLSPSHGAVKQSCSICASFAETCQYGNTTTCTQSEAEESLALVPAQKIESSQRSMPHLIHELREVRSGWPLLRKAFLDDKKKASERSKISVVQWAMRLPSRLSMLSSASVHPDRKPTKSDANACPNLDGDSRAIIPVETDVSHHSHRVQDEDRVELPKELESLHEKYGSTCRLFSYQELIHATSNFSEENLIGRGGSSRVYKGCPPDGKELAVKILKPSEDALKEFVLEIEIITTLHHENIISLFGFCFENKNLLLIYDFLSRGSLEESLHGIKDDKDVIGWKERYKVAVGVAKALNYLHSGGSGQPVIHRDVKSSNILLFDDFEPQLSDFGLAKWASSVSSHVPCSDVQGTFGYLAPEYFMHGKVNEKIDVYAFGVVLLELISGRKPISTECPKGQESLVMWAMPFLQSGKVKQLLDPALGDLYDNDQMEHMILAASLCIKRTPRLRPPIDRVLKLLEGDDDVIKWGKLQVSDSEKLDGLDEEAAYAVTNIQSHLNLALLDVEDDSLSASSTEHTLDFILAHGSLEDYLQGRWSRSSSFDQ